MATEHDGIATIILDKKTGKYREATRAEEWNLLRAEIWNRPALKIVRELSMKTHATQGKDDE